MCMSFKCDYVIQASICLLSVQIVASYENSSVDLTGDHTPRSMILSARSIIPSARSVRGKIGLILDNG